MARRITDTKFSTFENGDILIENADIYVSNFAGAPSPYTPNGGKRYFCVVIPKEHVDKLKDDGWNIKVRADRDGDEMFYTEINVNYDSNFPPIVRAITTFNGVETRSTLDKENVGRLDKLWIEHCNMAIHPYHYSGGRFSTKGYLNRLDAWIHPETHTYGGVFED